MPGLEYHFSKMVFLHMVDLSKLYPLKAKCKPQLRLPSLCRSSVGIHNFLCAQRMSARADGFCLACINWVIFKWTLEICFICSQFLIEKFIIMLTSKYIFVLWTFLCNLFCVHKPSFYLTRSYPWFSVEESRSTLLTPNTVSLWISLCCKL